MLTYTIPDMERTDTETRRNSLCIRAVDPKTGKNSIAVYLDYKKIQIIGKRSKGQLLEAAEIVPYVLQNFRQVFEGLCWDEDEKGARGVGWRCYCGLPLYAYSADGTQRQPYEGEVYLVFIDDENVAYNWRWEKSDCADKGLPNEYDAEHGDKKRFKRALL